MNEFNVVCEKCSYQGSVYEETHLTKDCPEKWVCPIVRTCRTRCLLGHFDFVKPPLLCPNCGSEDLVKVAK